MPFSFCSFKAHCSSTPMFTFVTEDFFDHFCQYLKLLLRTLYIQKSEINFFHFFFFPQSPF